MTRARDGFTLGEPLSLIEMNRIIHLTAALLTTSPAMAQLQSYDRIYQLEFPHGYLVVTHPEPDAEVVKSVPGPTKASVKGQFTNAQGQVFYLSDWSWNRRIRGQSFYWMLPMSPRAPARPPAAPPPQPRPQIQVLSQAEELFFLQGFIIVNSASKQAQWIKEVDGPVSANIKAYVDVEGERFYMSDWSYQRAREGKPANWMRALGQVRADVPAHPPKLPAGFHLVELEMERMFEQGYELVDSLTGQPRVVQQIPGPLLARTAVEVTGGGNTYYLTPGSFTEWMRGQSVSWMRHPRYPSHPSLIPRMRQLAGETELGFDLETFSEQPWWFSAELYPHHPENSLIALREFGVESALKDLAHQYDDREFPQAWLTEVALHLKQRGTLSAAIRQVQAYQPTRAKILQLYRQSEEGYEMEVSYAEAQIQFDQRLLSILEAEQENHAEVERLLSPLVADWNPAEDHLNASGPRMNMLREVARAQWRQGKSRAASASTRRWLDAYARNIANDLLHPDFVDASQRFIEFDSDFEQVGEYFALLETITDPQVAAEIIIGLKGLRLAVSTSQQVRRSSTEGSEAARLSEELHRLRDEERKLTLAGNPLPEKLDRRISEIRTELALRKLSGAHLELAHHPEWARISQEIARLQVSQPESWDLHELKEKRDLIALNHLIEKGEFIARPAAVARRLRRNEVLIDFFFVPPARVSDPGRYGALILRPDGSSALIDLREAPPIDSAVEEFRALMQNITDSVESLESRTRLALDRCRDLLLTPLRAEIDSAQRLVLCPDGQLSFLPFGSLSADEDLLAQDRWELTYVNAARDLLRDHGQPAARRTALLVGNPDFKRSGATSSSRSAATAPLSEAHRAALAAASRGIEFAPLPGTQAEVQKLAPKLTEAGYEVLALTERQATESSLTALKESPHLLHLATHGFFLPALPVADRESSRLDSGMLLSGLALSGAQNTIDRWGRGDVPPPSSDGILLASEVSQLDLSATDTVVLSACETAVGKVLSGEGVEGLRSGLTLAGAKHVVLTLWPVDDNATVEVMTSFYEELLSGTSAPLAMVRTKRKLLPQFTAEHGTYLAHRFVAPFLVTRSGTLPP